MTWFGKPDNRTEHRYFEDRLSAYLDGELAPQEMDAVERHLTTCAACQWDLETLRQTVHWMRELPTVPIPRVFTVPVPVQPERVTQRRWGLVPVLQAATALVALLLVFAVTGDFLLGSFRSGYVPETMLMQEPPSAVVEVTRVVEVVKEVEAPVAAEPGTAVEKVVVETVEVEMEMATPTPTSLPQATLAPAPAEPALGEGTRLTQEAPEEGTSDALAPKEGEKEEAPAEPQADETALASAPAPAAGGAPTPAGMAMPSAMPCIASPEPTVVAGLHEPAEIMPSQQDRALARTWRQPGVDWLRVAEVALAVAFLLLVTVTIVATVQRRRAG
jgi:anti-sigma factor RsiW